MFSPDIADTSEKAVNWPWRRVVAGRKYSKEFIQEAVEMTNVPGVTLKQLGEELGVTAALS